METNIAVREFMTRRLVVVSSETTIGQIHDLFETHHFHHIPVVDHGKVTGIISKADYFKIRHMLTTSWSGHTGVLDLYKSMTAARIMTRDPLTIESNDTIGLAADIFLANAMHALPVVDEGQLVGIITSHDLLDYAYRQLIES